MIRVLIADDQATIRDGLAVMLDLAEDVEVVGQAADGARAVELAGDLRPDVVLMDLRMPVLDGAGATARLLAQHPETAILVLTTYADDESIQSALAAGARGYLTKDAGRAELLRAVRATAAGQVTFAPEVGQRIVESFTARAAGRGAPAQDAAALHERIPALTRREAEVLELIVAGRNNPDIAAGLYLSPATVKSYVNSIFAKLGARDRGHAIALAMGRG